MKRFILLVALAFMTTAAHASQQTITSIDRALAITQVEIYAIHSGQYVYYRPSTIRNIIGSIMTEVRPALAAARTPEARASLRALIRSLAEEYYYSFRFQGYRLASTKFLILNYQRLLRIARMAETKTAGRGGVRLSTDFDAT